MSDSDNDSVSDISACSAATFSPVASEACSECANHPIARLAADWLDKPSSGFEAAVEIKNKFDKYKLLKARLAAAKDAVAKARST